MKLNFTLRSGTGDADIFVKRFSTPTLTAYDCASVQVNNTEDCVYTNVEDEQYYYVLLYGDEAFSGATLHAYHSNSLAVATTIDISGSNLSRRVYEVDVPAGFTALALLTSWEDYFLGHCLTVSPLCSDRWVACLHLHHPCFHYQHLLLGCHRHRLCYCYHLYCHLHPCSSLPP